MFSQPTYQQEILCLEEQAHQFEVSSKYLEAHITYDKAIEASKERQLWDRALELIIAKSNITLHKQHRKKQGNDYLIKQWNQLKPYVDSTSAITGEFFRALGSSYIFANSPKKANLYLLKALNLKKKTLSFDHHSIATTYRDLGNLRLRSHLYEEALSYYLSAKDVLLINSKENEARLISLYIMLSQVYKTQNNLDLALEYILKVESYYEQSHLPQRNSKLLVCYGVLCTVYRSLGILEASLEKGLLALETAKQLHRDHPALQYNHFYNLATTTYHLNDLKASEGYYIKALSIIEEFDPSNANGLSLSHEGLGRVHFKQKNWKRALSHYKKALFYKNEIDRALPHTKSPLLVKIGSCLAHLNRHTEALIKFEQATLLNLKPSNDSINHPSHRISYLPTTLLETLHLQSESLFHLYRQDTTQTSFLIDAISTHRSLEKHLKSWHINFYSTNEKKHISWVGHAFLRQAVEIYKAGYDHFSNGQYLNWAYEASELQKNLSGFATDHHLQFHLNSHIPQNLLLLEKQTEEVLSHWKRRRFLAETNSSSYSGSFIHTCTDSIFHFTNKLDSIRAIFKTRHAEHLAEKQGRLITPLDTVQKQLKIDETIVSYFVGEKNINIIVINKDSVHIQTSTLDTPLAILVNNFRSSIYSYWSLNTRTDSIYQKSIKEYCRQGHLLYSLLIEPVEKYLHQKLIIIPESSLNLLPFDALLTQRVRPNSNLQDFPFLLNKHNIHYAYSISLRNGFLSNSVAAKYSNALLVAPPFATASERHHSESRALGPLPFNITEVENIKAVFGGHIIKDASNLKNLFLTSMDRYNILHLATHAIMNNQSEDHSYIAFGNSDSTQIQTDRLYTKEIYTMNIPADLVVLSACETGIGKLQHGEGILSLGRAFMSAGAKSTVTSLWNINDFGTSSFFKYFYQKLQSGMEKDLALHLAKKSFTENPDYAHPYFWSGFMALGDMGPIPPTNSEKSILLYLIPITISVFFSLYFLRYHWTKYF